MTLSNLIHKDLKLVPPLLQDPLSCVATYVLVHPGRVWFMPSVLDSPSLDNQLDGNPTSGALPWR